MTDSVVQPLDSDNPNDGHRFRFSCIIQGSSAHYLPDKTLSPRTDEPYDPDGPVRVVTVRAWDLPAALRKLADAGTTAWSWGPGWEEDEDNSS